MKFKYIIIILLSLLLCSCAQTLMSTGQITPEDAVKLIKAEGASGCVYIKATGTYPGFASAIVTVIQAHDSNNKVTFKDCMDALPKVDIK